jgi:glycosyltransferase involved in cell wall biosynthesis
MTPHPNRVKGTSGIDQAVLAYAKYLPDFGIEFAENEHDDFDLLINNAGAGQIYKNVPLVAMVHGLHWTADHESSPKWMFKANQTVITSVRHADEVTVPSTWVAEAFQRDMRFTPHILPHGIDWKSWQHDKENQGYVLWNKNRSTIVCDPLPVNRLATMFPQTLFLTTFAASNPAPTPNIKITGVVAHDQMREWIQSASIYLSTTKETFGIGTLEAMASGVPVLGWANGGNLDLVQHCVNGYLAQAGNYDDLAQGLAYCLEHRDVLGQNGRELAKVYSWQASAEKLVEICRLAVKPQEPTVSIVIPSYNYSDKVGRAIESAINQTYSRLTEIIVVDDGSQDEGATENVVLPYVGKDKRVQYVRLYNNSGVAVARNTGIEDASGKYISCLDADDEMEPLFLETLVPYLENDKSLGVVYSRMRVVAPDGKTKISQWPGDCDFDAQLDRQNQVSTCSLFKRKVWERLGGYRQRYVHSTLGCGAEDAEFYLRAGAYGWGIKQVTKEPLFVYSLDGKTKDPSYREPDWVAWHPFAKDNLHPFPSIATPEFLSHPVRAYDEPVVSVIIPVGPGHGEHLETALDSLESQTFRKWEVIVVNDSSESLNKILKPYPYVRLVKTEGKKGPGFARNQGVEIARAPLVLFLDADDWLYPNALQEMVLTFKENNEDVIVYSDYIGEAIIEKGLADELEENKRLIYFNPQTGLAAIRYQATDYDCERAQRQPEFTGDPNAPIYYWCLVTSLIPKAWHEEIGGFDETMTTWEDVDYHWRLARRGKCYVRVVAELVGYNFYTGQRREFSQSLQIAKSVVEYINIKYEKEENMRKGCSGCSGGRRRTPTMQIPVRQSNVATAGGNSGPQGFKDGDMVLIEYTHPNRGDHAVVGSVTKTFYGYHGQGARFLVHKDDIYLPDGRMIGQYFKPIAETKQAVVEKPKKASAIAAPKPIAQPKAKVQPRPKKVVPRVGQTKADAIAAQKPPVQKVEPKVKTAFNWQTVPGVTPKIAEQFEAENLTLDKAIDLGSEGLQKFKGVGEIRAELIVGALKNFKEQGLESQ